MLLEMLNIDVSIYVEHTHRLHMASIYITRLFLSFDANMYMQARHIGQMKLIPFPDDFELEIINADNIRERYEKYIKTKLYERFDTSNITDMDSMFRNCKSLTELDLSRWDTSNVKYMNHMFSGCTSLITINFSRWDTFNVTDMREMFSGCTSLTCLDLSEWNVSNVTYMDGMFSGCTSLTKLDLRNWDTSNVTDMNYMFDGCNSLQTIIVTNQTTYDMLTKVKPLHTTIKL